MMLLPVEYIPGENDVLLGRGKDIFAHNANKRFRIMIQETMIAYDIAPTKADKTSIIREIVNRIKEMSPNGGFVAYDHVTGRYYKVEDKKAVSTHRLVYKCSASNRTSNAEPVHSTARKNVTSISRYVV